MDIFKTIPELRRQCAEWQLNKQTVAFIPTMGNLHAGHVSLVEKAHTVAERVVVSIFVNPLQFGAGEDYAVYPRTLDADCEKLAQVQTDAVFTPTVTDIYPDGMQSSTRIEVPVLSDLLCGVSRPGHFIGVATVVNKLFNMVQPHVALFGEKDYQQLLVVKKMVADLSLSIQIIGVPTVREADGLAMSSRNSYLTPEQRKIAPHLFQVLNQVRTQIEAGAQNFTTLENKAVNELKTLGFIPDYVAIRSEQTLISPTPEDTTLVILAAVYLGQTRLIDNVSCVQ